MTNDTSTGVLVWWTALSVASLINIAVWTTVASRLRRDKPFTPPGEYSARRQLLMLSVLFVLGCAFRSFLPRAEGQRICLYDSAISSAMWGRWVATVAELALITQWALVLAHYAKVTGLRVARAVSLLVVPLIVVAECFSWYTTLTTNFIGSVIEESTWALTGTLLIIGFAVVWPRTRGPRRLFVGATLLLQTAYVIFMCTVDVPMYWARWTTDQGRGKQYLTLAEGWQDCHRRRVVTRRWDDWKDEMPWMTLYFSAGVWVSISLSRVPRFDREGWS
jgi:hypothetical protein